MVEILLESQEYSDHIRYKYWLASFIASISRCFEHIYEEIIAIDVLMDVTQILKTIKRVYYTFILFTVIKNMRIWRLKQQIIHHFFDDFLQETSRILHHYTYCATTFWNLCLRFHGNSHIKCDFLFNRFVSSDINYQWLRELSNHWKPALWLKLYELFFEYIFLSNCGEC